MPTKKYLLLIALGIILLIGLGRTFTYYYNKKNQTTNILSAIPKDVVALVRVNQIDRFLQNDSTSSPFEGAVNPYFKKFLLSLSVDSKFGEMLSNPLLISFHPIGKNRIEPLALLSSSEELGEGQLKELIKTSKLKINEIKYNNRPLFTCTFPDGYSLYIAHSKGITTISTSLILIESAVRKLDSSYPTDTDLQNTYNLTNSNSDASLALNIKAIAPWLKSNIFNGDINLAAATANLCSWLVIDYQQGDEELTFSGMLTTSESNHYGRRMAKQATSQLLTPTLITENTAFCLERCYDSFSTDLLADYPNDKDSSKYDLKKLLIAINPERTILQHIKSNRTDSAGFVTILYPSNVDLAFKNLRNLYRFGSTKENHIVKLHFDSTSTTKAPLLGVAFQLVKASYALVSDDRIVLAKSEGILKMFQYENRVASLRKNVHVGDIWQKKITKTGIAAMYFSPSLSKELVVSVFNTLTGKYLSGKAFSRWNGLGVTIVPSGTNLLLSGYMSRKGNDLSSTRSIYSIKKKGVALTTIQQKSGARLLVVATQDSLTAFDGKLIKRWAIHLTAQPDTIYTINQVEREILVAVDHNAVTYIAENGEIISRFTFPSGIELVSEKSVNGTATPTYILDKKNMLFRADPFGKEPAQKMLKLGYKPAKITATTFKGHNYIVVSRNNKTDILNAKGALTRRIATSFLQGTVLVADNRLLLITNRRTISLNRKLQPQSDNMTGLFAGYTGIAEGMVGNSHTIFVLRNSNVTLLNSNLSSKRAVKTLERVSHIQPCSTNSKGFLAIDNNHNIYLFDSKGELFSEFPYNIGQAAIVINAEDGTLFAVRVKENALVSTPVTTNRSILL